MGDFLYEWGRAHPLLARLLFLMLFLGAMSLWSWWEGPVTPAPPQTPNVVSPELQRFCAGVPDDYLRDCIDAYYDMQVPPEY